MHAVLDSPISERRLLAPAIPRHAGQDRRMGRLALGTVSLGLLVACGGTGSHSPLPRELRRVEADFDQAWEAAVRTLIQRGYNIRTVDRSIGTIETGWTTFNPDYAATIFVTEHEDRYSL